MALHTSLPIYKVAYDLLDIVTDLVKNMPRDFKQSIGGKISAECVDIVVLIFRANSYFGLLRQATHSHADRARLANLLRDRGHTIKSDFTKTYRRST